MMMAVAIAFVVLAEQTVAQSCVADNKTRVAANDECLVIKTHGGPAERTSLIIFVHGDSPRGGPSDYLYRAAQVFGENGVVAVGLIRPGYYDSRVVNRRATVIATAITTDRM